MYRNTQEHYGSVSKFFHWFVFICVTVQLILGISMKYMNDGMIQGFIVTLHKSLGLVILLTMVLYIFWSLVNLKPHWPASMALWERMSAKFVHISLYILLLVMPLSGWVMTTAAGHAPRFFWMIMLPMPGIPQSKSLADSAVFVHNTVVWIVAALILIHILAALRHHFILKDNILRRMLPFEKKE